jgi:adenylylsulfate kinase
VDRSAEQAFAVWLTGLPASGKSTIAVQLAQQIRDLGVSVTTLESDVLRNMFPSSAQYGEQDRDYFYASLAFIGRVLTEQGIAVIFDATANLRVYRDRARRQIPRFIEVFVDSPIETCIQRDPKGIYRKARAGEADHVPGLQAPYEPPLNPDLVIRGDVDNPTVAAQEIVALLRRKGL